MMELIGAFGLYFAAMGAQAASGNAVEVVLAEVEPPPSMRAAFRATISSRGAVREIEYDPFKPAEARFVVHNSFGEDEELDQIVLDWSAEHQPDVRLFADDLRESIGAGQIAKEHDQWRIQFEHRLSANDGPVDALVSQQMVGAISFDEAEGALKSLTYRIKSPFRTPDGAVVQDYTQTYEFGRSERWGVTFITGYKLTARGGRFGLRDSRTFQVVITDVAFSLANDVRITMESKPYKHR